MKLTDYKPAKRGMVALFFDGEFVFSVPPDTFAQSRLQIGDEADAEALARLAFQAQEKKARNKALELLSYKPYTRTELSKRLLQKFDDAHAVESAVARMAQLGYLDDMAYARTQAQRLTEQKGYGKLRIRQELMRKGLDRECIDEALAELDTDEDEAARTIRDFVAKKYPGAREDWKIRRRAVAALGRRGFTYEEIRRAMEVTDDEL